jgi:hypothetical protein
MVKYDHPTALMSTSSFYKVCGQLFQRWRRILISHVRRANMVNMNTMLLFTSDHQHNLANNSGGGGGGWQIGRGYQEFRKAVKLEREGRFF